MYYLNSRYYDPETGRFVNANDISFLDPESINGLNLYAYCGDNPVMYIDPNGTFFWFIFIGAIISGAIIGGISGGVSAVQNGSSFASGFLVGALTGAVTGAAIGLGGAIGAYSQYVDAELLLGSISFTAKIQNGTLKFGFSLGWGFEITIRLW